MATIKSTLGLNDRMSSTLKSITKAMNSTLKAMYSVQKTDIGNTFTSAAADIKVAEKAVEAFNNDLNNMNSSSNKANKGLSSAITSLVGWYTVLRSMKAVMNLSDTYSNTTARINLMNDGLQTTAELQDEIYRAAQRSRGSYQALSDTVASLGMQAGEAFGSSKQIVAFSELLNKMFTTSGMDTTAIESVMYNLTQSLSSGKLLGQDYRILKQNAPQMIKYLQQYYDVSRAELDEMVSAGKVSANDIKKALFSASDDINAKFKKMPLTFSQAWQKFKNSSTKAFQPLLKILSQVLQSISGIFDFLAEHQYILYLIAAGIGMIVTALIIYNTYTSISTLVTNLLSTSLGILFLKFIIITAAILLVAGVLLYLWNTNDTVAYWMLYAWDMLRIGAQTLKVGALGAFYGILLAAQFMGLGVIGVCYSLLWAWDMFKTGLQGVVVGILYIFQSLHNGIIGIVNAVIDALNKIPGVSIDAAEYSNFADAALTQLQEDVVDRNEELQSMVDDMTELSNSIEENKSKYLASLEDESGKTISMVTEFEATRGQRTSERKKIGMDLGSATGDLSSAIKDGLKDVTGTDSSGGKALKTTTDDKLISDEDIQLLLDVATRDYKLNYQQVTPQITLTFGDVRETADVDDILDEVATRLEEIYDGNLEV